MSVSITLEQTTSIATADDGSDTYIVDNNIVAAQNISMCVFVYKTSTELYHHMATQVDLADYPETLAEALAANLEYYRQSVVKRTFTDIYLARDFAAVVKQRISGLVQDVQRTAENFDVGRNTYTYTSGA